MNTLSLINVLGDAELVVCVAAIGSIVYRKTASSQRFLLGFLATRLASNGIMMPLLHMAGKQIERHLAYEAYFYVYWVSYALESIFALMVIYSLYKAAMEPLKGLQNLGMLMFKWVGAVSIALAVGTAFGPKVSGIKFIVSAVTQLQQTQSILTLCMLLFVCFAIRPMGLSYRSRVFGVSLGLGVMATSNLVGSAWIAHNPGMYSSYNVLTGLAICFTLMIWTGYFAMPEPKRRMIVLPTTSPFLRWNQISLALGDEPGFVAIGGIPPDVFAPAELEVMRRASAKMGDHLLPASAHARVA